MAAQELKHKLVDALLDAHAMERNSLGVLESLLNTTSDTRSRMLLEDHHRQTRQQEERLRHRLEELGFHPSMAAEMGALVSAWIKTIQDRLRPDKPARNARDAYVFEQLEVATYQLLERLAHRAGDEPTARLAHELRDEELAMAHRIDDQWDRVVDHSLALAGIEQDALGVRTGPLGDALLPSRRAGWVAPTEADLAINRPGNRGAPQTDYDVVDDRIETRAGGIERASDTPQPTEESPAPDQPVSRGEAATEQPGERGSRDWPRPSSAETQPPRSETARSENREDHSA